MTPKLPEIDRNATRFQRLYTADQMREMWRQGMEDAAEICDENAVAIENEGGDAIRKEITP